MKLKKEYVKTFKKGTSSKKIVADILSEKISKSFGFKVMFQSGMSVSEIKEACKAGGLDVVYNHVYNTVSKAFPKEQRETSGMDGENINYFE